MLDMVSSCVVLYYIMLCIKNIVDGGNHFVLFYVVLCYPKNVVHGIKCCIIKACVCVCVCVRAPRARARVLVLPSILSSSTTAAPFAILPPLACYTTVCQDMLGPGQTRAHTHIHAPGRVV